MKLLEAKLTQDLLKVMKDIITLGKKYYIYINDDMYKEMCRLYVTLFTDKGLKIFRCIRRVKVIDSKEQK